MCKRIRGREEGRELQREEGEGRDGSKEGGKKTEEPKEGSTQEQREGREPVFAKGAFHPVDVCGGSLYTHSNPRQKDQDSFRAFGAGG